MSNFAERRGKMKTEMAMEFGNVEVIGDRSHFGEMME